MKKLATFKKEKQMNQKISYEFNLEHSYIKMIDVVSGNGWSTQLTLAKTYKWGLVDDIVLAIKTAEQSTPNLNMHLDQH